MRLFWPSGSPLPGVKPKKRYAKGEVYGTYAVGRNKAKLLLGKGRQRVRARKALQRAARAQP